MPPFVLDIYDVDEGMIMGSSSDYMCRAVIPVSEAAVKIINSEDGNEDDDRMPPEPKWHKCRFKQDGEKSGEILVSFILVRDSDHIFRENITNVKLMGFDDSAIVKFEEYRIELNVLGLRDLASAGLLPVKKAYIEFGL